MITTRRRIKNENQEIKPTHEKYSTFELKKGKKTYVVNSHVKKESYQKLANSLLALAIQKMENQEENNQ